MLEVKNLSVSFDGRKVVDDVSYTLRRGHTLGIVGESGSGKSVSSLAIMGLLPKNATVCGRIELRTENGDVRTENGERSEPNATGGSERITPPNATGGSERITPPNATRGSERKEEGIDLLTLDEKQMQGLRGNHISMIFQEPMTSLNPVQKCGEQVVEMLRLHENVDYKVARRRTIELFKEVLLPRPEKIFDSYPHEISGGQKQRVMIAMALICNPDIIIADEPTTALDVTVQKTILKLLRDLQQKHDIAVIFITHDLGVIAQVADEIAVMYHGKIVEQGDANGILHCPQHPYTKGLLACRPPLQGRPRHLPTVEEFMSGERREPNAAEGSERLSSEDEKRRMESGEPLLSVRNLDVTYTLEKSFFGKPRKKLKAVDGISFDVYRGETLGLVGESGCGKTTLGRAILRLIDAASGSITFEGRRLDSLSEGEMRRLRPQMQIIFQDPYSSLNPRMTVGQTIMEPLEVQHRNLSKAERKERVLDLMERVGLKPEWIDRYPHEFSGGQRQRICIARALILNPKLVICDESVSALDVSVQAQVLNLLNELKEHFGYTYIFISHDLSVVHFISDRIMVMQSGRMVEIGNSDILFNSPEQEYTRKLLDAIPRID